MRFQVNHFIIFSSDITPTKFFLFQISQFFAQNFSFSLKIKNSEIISRYFILNLDECVLLVEFFIFSFADQTFAIDSKFSLSDNSTVLRINEDIDCYRFHLKVLFYHISIEILWIQQNSRDLVEPKAFRFI
ncbi:hypothetical protein BpHYR1_013039 [Brachionus plicatilis]|uniref:Uncharacterized protein n=1 Tax=Brachionus plicatilis TaxID=10195 RepID=A0A3M7SIA1_BRAPC|nr:hypothetical protein BpHYR1_013039 [Brachionus plicatilis]